MVLMGEAATDGRIGRKSIALIRYAGKDASIEAMAEWGGVRPNEACLTGPTSCPRVRSTLPDVYPGQGGT